MPKKDSNTGGRGKQQVKGKVEKPAKDVSNDITNDDREVEDDVDQPTEGVTEHSTSDDRDAEEEVDQATNDVPDEPEDEGCDVKRDVQPPTEDITEPPENVADDAEEAIDKPEASDVSGLMKLAGLVPNKVGNVMGPDDIPIARLVEGNPKELAGKNIDEKGRIWNDSGKPIGRVEMIPEDERETKAEGPFAGLERLWVVDGDMVEDKNGNVVGRVADGDAKNLLGQEVDEDGDITDKYGNVKGHVEPYEPPEEEQVEEDLSALAGKTVNKAGNVVDQSGVVIGRAVSGDPKRLAGKKVDEKGQIWGDSGKVISKAELIPEGEREKPEGPFSVFSSLTVAKDGVIHDGSGEIVGRVIEGDANKLRGRNVDEDGDIIDRAGNFLGKAERWEPEEKKLDINPMSGRKINKEGEVRDADGNVIGKLTEGNLKNLTGKSIDDNGYVVDNAGNKIGECTLLENIPDEVPEPEPEITQEQLDAEKQEKEDKELAKKMCAIVQQTLDKVGSVCKMIKEHTETADRPPKEELDEEDLVQKVKPLIEEGSGYLQECNGALRALDPDGQMAAKVKSKAARCEASPEEHQLAELLKELTSTVVTTIDNAKRRIAGMPHAKKKLNPLWGLLSEPLFQIVAAVGLLLSGVLGLVGKLLNGLGLGGLVNGLLGGLGIDKLLSGLGLGGLTDALNLGGDKKK
ncbi:hypothetical protein PAAG_04793 [Paracoccidioides lutzii Pb01]|uniref:DUF6987 domain-containing protein n=1 Tax=Paracoccidioides lutzii (strain ATCC MYA-826 / Pb01) TaxID=502779 RepID=C1H2G4_PARBA|nr:hypothetical protein PAAG_04793 [Paracoccidioides lutzii Pb01]EEH33744.1 hypothetical protein PAAG_04793 [Paracoccidioides lutzii Pb01]